VRKLCRLTASTTHQHEDEVVEWHTLKLDDIEVTGIFVVVPASQRGNSQVEAARMRRRSSNDHVSGFSYHVQVRLLQLFCHYVYLFPSLRSFENCDKNRTTSIIDDTVGCAVFLRC
jgi:hypothetical protein